MVMGERVRIGGLNFTMIRLLLLFGWLRLVPRGELHPLKLIPIDKVILFWVASSIVMHTLLWQSSQEFINRLSGAYSTIGTYFLFRYLLHDIDDILRVFKIVAVFLAPLAALMIVEKMTGRNIFAVFGGGPESTYVRDGALRCQGPFAHHILSGTFGATSFPLCVALWWQGRAAKVLAVTGIGACLIIILTSASSAPVLAGLAGVVGRAMRTARPHLRKIRWETTLSLILFHLVMKSPICVPVAR